MSDYPLIRALTFCPRCHEDKDKGQLLCWGCHRSLKAKYFGGYGPDAPEMLAEIEAELSRKGPPIGCAR